MVALGMGSAGGLDVMGKELFGALGRRSTAASRPRRLMISIRPGQLHCCRGEECPRPPANYQICSCPVASALAVAKSIPGNQAPKAPLNADQGGCGSSGPAQPARTDLADAPGCRPARSRHGGGPWQHEVVAEAGRDEAAV